MRHKGFLSTAADACNRCSGSSQLAHHTLAGPSRLALIAPAPSSLPSPPPPPISTLPSSSSSSSLSSSPILASTSAGVRSRIANDPRLRPAKFISRGIGPGHLSFLYPPSCLELTRNSAIRAKSSLAPTIAVAAPATAAQQLATPSHDEHDHHHHLSARLEPDFTFLRRRYHPPQQLVRQPANHTLLQQDANSPQDHIAAPNWSSQHAPFPANTRPQHLVDASAAALLSLRRRRHVLRQSLQNGRITDPDTIVKQCRRLVLQSCRVTSRWHASTARAIASETVSDCASHLAAAAQPVAAAKVVRYCLVKLGWHPRPNSQPDSAPPSASGATLNRDTSASSTIPTTPSTPSSTLWLAAQQIISQLTLAPSPLSPRPSRRFESPQHLDAATSLVSAMHLSQMPRSTASQTALLRALIASSQIQLAVHTYASEVRAWWAAHKKVRRPSSLLRRQATLLMHIGKPSSQALREITRAMQHLEQLVSRVRPDVLSLLPQHEQEVLHAKRAEYADSLVELIRLVRAGRLPLPPAASAPEIAWIVSASCRFEATMLLEEPVAKNFKPTSPSLDAAEKRTLRSAAQIIRCFLCEYMRSLPDGKSRSSRDMLVQGVPVIRPAIGIVVYNRLIHYALSTLRSPSMCREVFQHMTQLRQPPLEPDAVTFNIILRQATTQRYGSLARAVLTTKRAEQPQSHTSDVSSEQPSPVVAQTTSDATAANTNRVSSPSSSAATAAVSAASKRTAIDSELRSIRPMIQQIDAAIAQADSYRLVALVQYVTASGLFLRRYRHEPGHAGVKELVMRIYPSLNKQRSAQAGVMGAPDSQQQRSNLALRPKANQASRHAILDPHVLTATLNLAAKAGKTGLALRIWRLIKRTSLQSALQSAAIDVAKKLWQIPVEAATILMSVLASEAARAPKVRPSLRVHRQRTSSVGVSRKTPLRTSRLVVRRQYARGWNMVASLRGRSRAKWLSSSASMHNRAAEFGEGLRWRAAQLLAKREYAFLVHHWQLSRRLSSSRRQRLVELVQMGQGESSARSKVAAEPAAVAADAQDALDTSVQPDSRFYDALLDVFGHRPGMMQRSRRHRSRAETLAQLRRGYKQMLKKVSAASDGLAPSGVTEQLTGTVSEHDSPTLAEPPTLVDKALTLSTSQLLHTLAARISCNSRGRSTCLTPDPFLVRILVDMQVLQLDIPVGYRWILAHCTITTTTAGQARVPNLLQNSVVATSTRERGAFSAFRGARVKTVGLVARRGLKRG